MVNNGKPKGVASGVDRRSFLKATGAGSATVALAGCTETITGGGGGDGGIPDTITIGAMGPADAPFGDSILKSAQLAADEMNENGGIAGADVEVLTRDTMDQPSTARTGYQELTSTEGAHATVGIFGSEQLLALMPEFASAETVHLTAGAASTEAPALVADDYETNKYWFRVGPVNSVFLLEAMIQYAGSQFEAMGWETVAVLAEDYKWTEPITSDIESRLVDEVGVDVVDVRRVASGTEDFTPVYDQLEASDIDGAFTALAHTGTNSLVQWAQQQRPFGYGGIHVPTQLPSFYSATQGAAISTFSQTTATPTSEITDKTIPYAEAFNEANDGYPVYTGYSAYDAMYMLKEAIESAESVNSDDLVTELENISYTGTAGNIEFFGQDGEFPHDVRFGEDYTTGVFFQWQADSEGNGVQEVLWPDNLATGEYVPAPWNQ
ncbi:ABC transporter substrate-binding protein [Salinirubellus salinus]|uniref:ABC transporter substrate-binding protein n=1 Tax=Salinirubellus salinus TaxID=1364945 RepID=A0A9E7R5X1_9EURY|nr:ABC transporter substrate-binding protein [Salinirubellus salinus]UWM56495.1 ABC transporter substrate-binding protein [Salinirubellus salinus]